MLCLNKVGRNYPLLLVKLQTRIFTAQPIFPVKDLVAPVAFNTTKFPTG